MGRTYFNGKTVGVDIPLGGEEGQFLAKRSDKDDDYTWGSVSGDISPTSDAPVSSKAVAEALETKVDKEEGKGLSTEDFTSEEKEKLDDIDLSDYVPTSSIGAADGVASLDTNGRVPYSQLPVSAMEFKGTWNASTNTPTLTAGQGTNGDFYVVSVGGTWNNITFNANDRVLFDGVTAHDWVKLVAGEVNSVNGMSGDVVLPYPAPLFNPLNNYNTGDYVTYNGATYRFTGGYIGGEGEESFPSSVTVPVYAMGQYVTVGKKNGTDLGLYATAEGQGNEASNYYSHAEGNCTKASGYCSHAEGFYTKTGASYQHVQGKYNVGKTTTLFEVGNGTAEGARSNAFEVDSNGNVVASGTITDGQGRVLGSGGHVIKDETGTSVTQRENLQFVGLNVDDDGTNTVVSDPVFTGTTAEWTAVTDKSKYKIVHLTDDGETGEVVDAVTDGDMRPVTSNAVYDKLSAEMIVVGGKVSFASGTYAQTAYLGGKFREVVSATATATETETTTACVINNNNSINIGRRPATTVCDVYYTVCGYRN